MHSCAKSVQMYKLNLKSDIKILGISLYKISI